MGSTANGRNWSSWASSSRKGFTGMRRTANCAGGYVCTNVSCKFNLSYKNQNTFHFRRVVCKTCTQPGDRVVCKCKKVWEFHNESGIATIYHYGSHNCTPIPYASDQRIFPNVIIRNTYVLKRSI